jgi:pumilio homology domain family member 6
MAQKQPSPSKKRKEAPKSSKDGNTKNNKKDDEQHLTKSQRKQEQRKKRKHGDVVLEAKKIWNQLRLKTNTKEEVQTMTTKLVELLEGKVHEIALQHDASRVVQAALQFGTNEERQKVLKELTKASLVELTKNQYAHFVVLKSIKYGVHDTECVKMIVKVRLHRKERK